MSNETNEKVYAKVHDNGYIEFPIYEVNIKARNQSTSDYEEVIFSRIPEIPEFYTLTSDLYYYDGKVRYDYNIAPLPLATLLKTANGTTNSISITNDIVETDVYYSTVETKLAERIYFLISEYVSEKLEEFAKTKNYTVLSCISYIGDPNPDFNKDGSKMKELRSQVWVTMIAYSASILNNTIPIPKTLADIDSNIPPLSWE